MSHNHNDTSYIVTVRTKDNNNLLGQFYLPVKINKLYIRTIFELDSNDLIEGSYQIVTLTQQNFFDNLLPSFCKLNYDKFNVYLECNNRINVQYKNLTSSDFDKEIKEIYDFEYELTETRSSYCAVFRTLGFGLAWEYDLLDKTYKCEELTDDGLGNRTILKGCGLTAKEAYNNLRK